MAGFFGKILPDPLGLSKSAAGPYLDPGNFHGNNGNPAGAGGDPYAGLIWPEYSAGYDPNSVENQARQNQFTMQMGGLNKSIGDLKGYANKQGDSSWAIASKKKTFEDEKAGKDVAAAKGAAQAAKASSELAQSGGLTSGARERLSAGAAKNAMDMSQDVSREGNQNRLQVGINDQQNKVQTLNALPGMESGALNAWTSYDNAETGRRTAENQRRQDFNLKMTDMRNQIAMNERQAQATENAPTGSSFICTAIREAGLMSVRESVLLTRFMLKSVLSRADFFAWYFSVGKEAVELAERQNFDFSAIKKSYVDDIITTLKIFGISDAQDEYILKAHSFFKMFLGEKASGWKDSMAKPGRLKSLLALPKLFFIKDVWVWSYGYSRAVLLRKRGRMFLKLRII